MQEQIQQTSQIGTPQFVKSLKRVSQVMSAVGAVMFGAMMFITVIDVGGRYFFLRPLNGAAELVGLLLVIGGTWGMGYCQFLKMNIRINILADRFSPRAQSILWILAWMLSAAIAGLVAWQAYLKVYGYFESALGSITDVLGIPYWPVMLMMALGFSWACILFIIDLVKSIAGAFKR